MFSLLTSFEQSGLSLREYCREHQLSTSTLSCAVRRHRKKPLARTAPAATRKATLLPVEILPTPETDSSMATALRIEMPGGYRIAVGRDFEESTLLRLLSVLERS